MAQTNHPSEDLDRIKQIDRPRGILSKSDRKFLLDPQHREELEPQSRRNIRSRIRERLRHAIIDFYVLDEFLDDRDRNQVFSEIDVLLNEGLHGTMSLLFRAAGQQESKFETWLEGGLTHIELNRGEQFIVEQANVELSITPPEAVNPDLARNKVEEGRLDELSQAEMQFLLWRAGSVLGSSDPQDPIFGILGIFADRFEAKTRIDEMKELEDEKSEGQGE